LGATLADAGRYDEGLKELELALTLDPNYAGAHLNLASLQVYFGNKQKALHHYRRAVETGDERARQAARAGMEGLLPEK
ncbi:MAG: tetratricopeptide repeat protein, partial [Bryobacteraceae bacterium]